MAHLECSCVKLYYTEGLRQFRILLTTMYLLELKTRRFILRKHSIWMYISGDLGFPQEGWCCLWHPQNTSAPGQWLTVSYSSPSSKNASSLRGKTGCCCYISIRDQVLCWLSTIPYVLDGLVLSFDCCACLSPEIWPCKLSGQMPSKNKWCTVQSTVLW